jgi:hypothetical protein
VGGINRRRRSTAERRVRASRAEVGATTPDPAEAMARATIVTNMTGAPNTASTGGAICSAQDSTGDAGSTEGTVPVVMPPGCSRKEVSRKGWSDEDPAPARAAGAGEGPPVGVAPPLAWTVPSAIPSGLASKMVVVTDAVVVVVVGVGWVVVGSGVVVVVGSGVVVVVGSGVVVVGSGVVVVVGSGVVVVGRGSVVVVPWEFPPPPLPPPP